ncbi:MAG: hypothetical protein LUO93_09055 [Methanomicrobiales archaeon]|nr:hypothetical protein [Methanomicrobiales archaeon]
MPTAGYGIGFVSARPSGSNPTPVVFGLIKKMSAKMNQKIDMLYGSLKFPEEAAAGASTIEGSIDFHRVGSRTFAAILSGAAVTTGIKTGVNGENGQVATNTFTVAHGANMYEDLGVFNTVTGLWMVRGSTASGAGIYAVNETTGVYTFNAADSNPLCKFYYSYTEAGVGETVTLTNDQMGTVPVFELAFFTQFGTRKRGLKLPAVVFEGLSLDFGSEEWMKASVNYHAMADSTGTVQYAYEMD